MSSKIKRYIELDRLLRNEDGMSILDLLGRLEDKDIVIEERQLRKDLELFHKEFNAKFVPNLYAKKERLWRYSDISFNIFNVVSTELETLASSIEKLKIFRGDPRFDMVRFSLQQLKEGLNEDSVPIISFQYNPDSVGLEHLESLADAILKNHTVKLKYKPFEHEAFFTIVHPYHIKQHNNRWILVGLSEEKGRILTYPLDRIIEIAACELLYKPTTINFDEYFDDVIGTTNDLRKEVKTIILRVSKKSIDYIRTKPLHGSQVILKNSETENSIDIRLKVKLNKELEMLILSYGDAIEVVEPLELRQQITEIATKMAVKYEV